jgi:hypothetical protein
MVSRCYSSNSMTCDLEPEGGRAEAFLRTSLEWFLFLGVVAFIDTWENVSLPIHDDRAQSSTSRTARERNEGPVLLRRVLFVIAADVTFIETWEKASLPIHDDLAQSPTTRVAGWRNDGSTVLVRELLRIAAAVTFIETRENSSLPIHDDLAQSPTSWIDGAR